MGRLGPRVVPRARARARGPHVVCTGAAVRAALDKSAENPQRGRRDGPKSTLPREPLSRAEVFSLLSTFSSRYPTGVRDRALVALLIGTGLRISEALALEPHNLEGARLRVLRGKGQRARVVGVDPHTLEHVARWLEVRREIVGRRRRCPLFCTVSRGAVLRPGARLTRQQVAAMLRRHAKRAGLSKRVHPHGMRHTFATALADEGQPLRVIQQALGHTWPSTTAAYIAELAGADVIDAVASRDPFSG